MMKLRPKGAESSQPRASPWVVCIVVFRPEGALRCQPRDVRLCRLSTNGAQETPWVVCVWRGMRPVRPKALYYRAFALSERHLAAAFNIPRAQPWADVFKAFSLYCKL